MVVVTCPAQESVNEKKESQSDAKKDLSRAGCLLLVQVRNRGELGHLEHRAEPASSVAGSALHLVGLEF